MNDHEYDALDNNRTVESPALFLDPDQPEDSACLKESVGPTTPSVSANESPTHDADSATALSNIGASTKCDQTDGAIGGSTSKTKPAQIISTERAHKNPRPRLAEISEIEVRQLRNSESVGAVVAKLRGMHNPETSRDDDLVATRYKLGLGARALEVVQTSRVNNPSDATYQPLISSAADATSIVKTLPAGAKVPVHVYRRSPYTTKVHELLAALLEPTSRIDRGVRGVAILVLSERTELREVFSRKPKLKELHRIVGVSHPTFGKRQRKYEGEIRRILGAAK
ncbi:MAG: hypothetical protein WD081_03700 [Gammaproteobacteria bacterium]